MNEIKWLLLMDNRSIYPSVTIIKMVNEHPESNEQVMVEDPCSFCKGFIVAKDRDNVKVYALTEA